MADEIATTTSLARTERKQALEVAGVRVSRASFAKLKSSSCFGGAGDVAARVNFGPLQQPWSMQRLGYSSIVSH